ncbi:MAG: hypothetical protein AB7L84_15605 [Acidimicrobiia bacterium]
MPTRSKIVGAAAFSAALAGGALAGAALGAPGLSAAEVPFAQLAATTGSEGSGHPGPGLGAPGGLALDVAAEALGVTEDDLRTALRDGQTIAEVAEANGVELQTVVDALVAAGIERIDQWAAEAKESLPERVAEAVERDWADGPVARVGIALDAAAEALGISEDDLRTALRDGQSLAEVAEANGVDRQAVVDALVAQAEARLDDAVADGDLTDEQAASRKEDLAERIGSIVDGEGPFGGGGPGHGGGRGGPRGPFGG